MKQDILVYFEKRLLLHDECTLPGLGSFTVTPINTSQKAEISASTYYTLQFTATHQEANANKLITYICIKEDISETDVRNELNNFVQAIIQQINDKNIAPFGHWGKWQKNTDGSLVFHAYTFANKQLTIKQEAETESIPNQNTAEKNIEENTDITTLTPSSDINFDASKNDANRSNPIIAKPDQSTSLLPKEKKSDNKKNEEKKTSPVISVKKRWLAAAALFFILLIGAAAYFAFQPTFNDNNNIVSYYPKTKESSQVGVLTNADVNTIEPKSSLVNEKATEAENNMLKEKQNKDSLKNKERILTPISNVDSAVNTTVEKELKSVEITKPAAPPPASVANEKVNSKTAEMISSNSITPTLETKPTVEYSSSTAIYPGGSDELKKFLMKNLNPSVATQNGTVLVRIVIDQEGNVTAPSIAQSLNTASDKEALRVVNKMTKWVPAKQNGASVAQKLMIPITFRAGERP
jgi:TonB family protein